MGSALQEGEGKPRAAASHGGGVAPGAGRVPVPVEMPAALPATQVLEALSVAPGRGLSQADVRARLTAIGPNVLTGRVQYSTIAILADQVRSLIVWLLAAAAAVSFYLGDHAEGGAVAAVLVLNTAIGFFTELRAVRSMEALHRIAQVRTRVRREGASVEVDAADLVPGDIVIIEAGDVITADLRLVEAANVQCDESVLTGESAPVAKQIEPLEAATPLTDRTNIA